MKTVSLTTWDQARVLAYFWTMVRTDCDRLALLRQLSAVAIHRPQEWDRAAVRAEELPSPPVECFVCKVRDRRIHWHHVIQVQHGGSSEMVNLVGLCGRCHARVHPWLVDALTPRRRWIRVRELIAPVMDWLERRFKRSA
jgi:hypothetical protein